MVELMRSFHAALAVTRPFCKETNFSQEFVEELPTKHVMKNPLCVKRPVQIDCQGAEKHPVPGQQFGLGKSLPLLSKQMDFSHQTRRKRMKKKDTE